MNRHGAPRALETCGALVAEGVANVDAQMSDPNQVLSAESVNSLLDTYTARKSNARLVPAAGQDVTVITKSVVLRSESRPLSHNAVPDHVLSGSQWQSDDFKYGYEVGRSHALLKQDYCQHAASSSCAEFATGYIQGFRIHSEVSAVTDRASASSDDRPGNYKPNLVPRASLPGNKRSRENSDKRVFLAADSDVQPRAALGAPPEGTGSNTFHATWGNFVSDPVGHSPHRLSPGNSPIASQPLTTKQ